MKINGLVVCVNYADMLALGIARWMTGLDSLTVVTDTRDRATPELAAEHRARCVATNKFYEHGAAFNKGAAMEYARTSVMPFRDWCLLLDADVVPEEGWRDRIEGHLQTGRLHGCWRLDARDADGIDKPTGRVADDVVGYGYFQLFHTEDPIVRARKPLLDTDWQHGGNYDSTLLLAWGQPAVELPLRLWHIGGVSHNWYGRGEREKFAAMEAGRAARGGGWPSLEAERIVRP